MRFQLCHLFASLVLPWLGLVAALPTPDVLGTDGSEAAVRGKRLVGERNGVMHTIFEHEATGAKIDFVSNSGICETTPGVNQHSGYLNVGGKTPLEAHQGSLKLKDDTGNENLFFWFFEARHNATTAPLAVWFNGGPGRSSMVGLF